jgi:hypothetical protein
MDSFSSMAKYKVDAVLLPSKSALIGLRRNHRGWREIDSKGQYSLLTETSTLN